MAVRRPVFIDTSTGELTRFATTDTVANDVDFSTVTNPAAAAAGANDIVPGTPVYQTTTADQVAEADASALATAEVSGLAIETIPEDGGTGSIQSDGRLTLTTAQWDAVTGGSGGLTTGSKYFLSLTTGQLTTTAPSADGEVIASVGKAQSTTVLHINITRIIIL